MSEGLLDRLHLSWRSIARRWQQPPNDPWPWPQDLLPSRRRPWFAASIMLLSVGLAAALFRVSTLEQRELDHVSGWSHLAPTPDDAGRPLPLQELTRVRLARGSEVTFEVCTLDPMLDDRWEGSVDFAVWHLDSRHLVLTTPLDRGTLERARRGDGSACVLIARGGELGVGGNYAVAAVWAGRDLPYRVRSAPLWARVVAREALSPTDLWPLALIMLGAIGLALSLTPPRGLGFVGRDGTLGAPASSGDFGAGHERLQVAVALGALLLVGIVVCLMPIEGATGVLARGFSMALTQIAVAATLVAVTAPPPGGRRAALGFEPPRRGRWLVWFAPALGLGLWLVGRQLVELSPGAYTVPVEAATLWPSGQLAVALVGVVAPLVEETFFRGLLYGAIARAKSEGAALLVTTIVFAAAHLPQCWGAWGALAAVSSVAVVLGLMRYWTGSILAPAITHIVYNGSITIVAFASTLLE